MSWLEQSERSSFRMAVRVFGLSCEGKGVGNLYAADHGSHFLRGGRIPLLGYRMCQGMKDQSLDCKERERSFLDCKERVNKEVLKELERSEEARLQGEG